MSKSGFSMPNQWRSTRLTMPIFGLASRIHATVKRMPGMMSGMIDSAKKRFLNGVLVRSFIHASAVPSVKATNAVPVANCTEFQKSRTVSPLP
jgi:hypothetical protein